MRVVGTVFLAVLAFLALLLSVAVVRTLFFMPSASMSAQPTMEDVVDVDPDQTALHLAEAVRFKTVSHQDPADNNPEVFDAFHAWLLQTYPHFYAAVETRSIIAASQLNIWKGTDPTLAPVVFLAHQDVVPADEGENAGWQQPPFAGVIQDGFIWGRGSIDDKGSLIGLLEAADRLAAQGFAPKRTIIFAFGHDEEVSGTGAHAMADWMNAQGIHPWAVIDEGGAITTNMPDVKGPLARIGVAEKGYLTLVLRTKGEGGHSSTPPSQTAIGELAHAVDAVQSHPFRHDLDPVLVKMLHVTAQAEEVGFVKRMILTNLWLFKPLVKAQFSQSEVGNAMTGTTIAPTIIQGGVKENALPREAHAMINFRIHARDSVQSVSDHVIAAINDPGVEVAPASGLAAEPSPVSQIGTGPYAWLEQAVRDGFPNTLVAPNVVVGATDSRYYAQVTDDIYRFAPYVFDASDLHRIHGLNERMGVENFAQGIRVYGLLIKRAGDMGTDG